MLKEAQLHTDHQVLNQRPKLHMITFPRRSNKFTTVFSQNTISYEISIRLPPKSLRYHPLHSQKNLLMNHVGDD